jgi:hypothetical protein
MNSKLEAVVEYLAGEGGTGAERVREEFADSASEVSQFLAASRRLSRDLLAEPVLVGLLGLPPNPTWPSTGSVAWVPHVLSRALPWVISLGACVLTGVLWLNREQAVPMPNRMLLPVVKGQSLRDARKVVEDHGLVLVPNALDPRTGQWSGRDARDPELQTQVVVDQFPKANTWVVPGATVTGFLMPRDQKADGPKPDLTNKTLADVERMGWKLDPQVPDPKTGRWTPGDASQLRAFTAVDQFPKANTWVVPGATVTGFLMPRDQKADGPKLVPVPDLTNKTLADVERMGWKLDPQVPDPKTGRWTPGNASQLRAFTVVDQFPKPGALVLPKTLITCFVLEPPPAPPPPPPKKR